MNPGKRIVVTGMGIVSPLGYGVEKVWLRLTAGKSGIRTLPGELTEDIACKVGGRVPDRNEDPEAGFDANDIIAPKDRKKWPDSLSLRLLLLMKR